MSGPALIALDLSLTGTGVATYDHTGPLTVRTLDTGKLRGHERLTRILGHIGDDLRRHHPALAVIEGLYVGHNNNTLPLAELHGIVKHYLWAHDVPYLLVPPATLKIYAAGKGNATKDDVLLAVERRFGHLAHIADNNSGDALALLALACDAYGQPLAPLPQAHRRAVAAITWPELRAAAREVTLP